MNCNRQSVDVISFFRINNITNIIYYFSTLDDFYESHYAIAGGRYYLRIVNRILF